MVSNGQKINLQRIQVNGDNLSSGFFHSGYGVDINFTLTLDEDRKSVAGYLMNQYKMEGSRR